MPLSKETRAIRGSKNPFQSWWDRHDEAWRTHRLKNWPHVSRSLHRNLDNAGAQMADFKAYYLTGAPCKGLAGYIPTSMRLAMIPFESADEARQAIEAYVGPEERVLRRALEPSLLDGSSIQLEGLSTQRYDAPGIRKLIHLGEAAFPEAFTAADAASTDPSDPDYFLGHGKGNSAKPLPFIRSYQQQAAGFLLGETGARGRRYLVNPSDRVREYYLSCLRYMEEVGRSFDPEDRGSFQEDLSEFLAVILFFDALHPEIDPDSAMAHFARGWRKRLEAEDLPSILAAERDQLLAEPPEIEPLPAPPPEDPFAHLRFFSESRLEYVLGFSPDADSRVEAMARFADRKQRDLVASMVGEPGRPTDRSAVGPEEMDLFDAVQKLPLPYRVRLAGDAELYVEFVDWHYEYQSVLPLADVLKASGPELAYISSAMIEEDGAEGLLEVRGDQVTPIDKPKDSEASLDSLWREFRRLSKED